MFEIKDLLTLGGIAGAFLAIFRLFDAVKKQGADRQQILDRLQTIEKGLRERRENDKILYTKLDAINEKLNALHAQNIKDHGELSERISVLEASGCAPVKK